MSFFQIFNILLKFILRLFCHVLAMSIGEIKSVFYQNLLDNEFDENHRCLVSSQYSINIKATKFINASIPDIIVVNCIFRFILIANNLFMV